MTRLLGYSLTLTVLAAALVVISTAVAKKPAQYAVETGPAAFLRHHDTAMTQAKKSGKPVFAFFQEVPG